jgi:hydrogenase maturation protein HypF
MAENNIDGDVLGVSWDGTGYGTDGTIWGSEFLIPNGNSFDRIAHLKTFRLPGGEKAIHEIWRIGYSLLYEIFGRDASKYIEIDSSKLSIIEQMLLKNINSPVTSSMGRLFDGIASILNIRQRANYEAQGAIELEFAALPPAPDHMKRGEAFYTVNYEEHDGICLINWHYMINEIIDELRQKTSISYISSKFHNTLSEIILNIAQQTGFEKVVLSGGCFQNRFLIEKSISKLQLNGFKVYRHQRVPTNDGGISLGQIKYASINLSASSKGEEKDIKPGLH